MPPFASYPSLKGRRCSSRAAARASAPRSSSTSPSRAPRSAFVDIDEAASKALAKKIAGAGHPEPAFAKCDVRDMAAYQDDDRGDGRQLGAFTVLVNNAARDDRHGIEEVTQAFWDERMHVNLRHQYFAIQSVVPGMKKAGGGSIINFSSVSYHAMTPQLSVYEGPRRR